MFWISCCHAGECDFLSFCSTNRTGNSMQKAILSSPHIHEAVDLIRRPVHCPNKDRDPRFGNVYFLLIAP